MWMPGCDDDGYLLQSAVRDVQCDGEAARLAMDGTWRQLDLPSSSAPGTRVVRSAGILAGERCRVRQGCQQRVGQLDASPQAPSGRHPLPLQQCPYEEVCRLDARA